MKLEKAHIENFGKLKNFDVQFNDIALIKAIAKSESGVMYAFMPHLFVCVDLVVA